MDRLIARMKKVFPYLFILAGMAALAVAAGADRVGLGGRPGIGFQQALLLVAGVGLVFTGVTLASPSIRRLARRFWDAVTRPVGGRFLRPPIAILVIAAWFGLVSGLVEGVLSLTLSKLDFLAGVLTYLGGGVEVLWIAAAINFALFTLLGLAFIPAARFFNQSSFLYSIVFIFAWLMFLDWLALFLFGRLFAFTVALLAFTPAILLARSFRRRQASCLALYTRSLPWLAGLTLVLLLGIRGGRYLIEQGQTARLPTAAPASPNIVVIVIDTLRADHLSSYGYTRRTSPHIDQIAAQGVRFNNAISTSSWTQPAHVSLITGRYPSQAGDETGLIAQGIDTIGETLQAAGYRTAAFSGNFYVFSSDTGFGAGFVHFEDYYRSPGNIFTGAFYGRVIEYALLHPVFGLENKLGRYQAEQINQAVLQWVDKDHHRPFFALINYYDVHDPYLPPQPYRGQFSPLESPGGLINTDWDQSQNYLPLDPAELQSEIDAYDGAIAYVDDQIASLLKGVQALRPGEDTLLVIVSDHGELFGEHDLFGHGNSLYRELIRVPLIIWWPGHVPPGASVDQPVTLASVPATLLDLIGEQQAAGFTNPSLAPLWQGQVQTPARTGCLSELEKLRWVPPEYPAAKGEMRSLVTPRYHYIVHEVLGKEIYDWQQDPYERVDLSANPDLAPVLSQFDQETWGEDGVP
jgi:arylsulfatase A-like enzyme